MRDFSRAQRAESGLALAPGQSIELALQWFIEPDQDNSEWPWTITVDGLMSGDFDLPQQHIAAPAFVHLPHIDQ